MGSPNNFTLVYAYDVIDILKQYARDNYVKGGHWAVESLEDNDYLQFLPDGRSAFNPLDIQRAKKSLRLWWELTVEQEQGCY
jgi:hypothetical protein